ncbi:ribonuclease H-like [Uranotaenia lowii]|uniref:ribonuclease H-like n=1 Tax=Uranotaenia lowii TaxID=190385 RepID=UPI00247AE517|nr:ribonuclease H-like [Uranotaenia lowii]
MVDEKYSSSSHIFTDGSKNTDGKVGCGIHDSINNRFIALPNQCSVFSSEAYALMDALQNTQTPNPPVIFSDSASVLKAVSGGNLKHLWITTISEKALNRKATLVWIPGHAGIPGNVAADRLALRGTEETPLSISIPQQDAYRYVKNQLSLAWERKWVENRTAKLREAKNSTLK